MTETPSPEPSACPCSNLNPKEVQKRKVLGAASMVAAFVVVGLTKLQPPSLAMACLPGVPFFFAYLNLFQARHKTCVLLAAMERDHRGERPEPLSDRQAGWELKKRSLRIVGQASALAIASAALCAKL